MVLLAPLARSNTGELSFRSNSASPALEQSSTQCSAHRPPNSAHSELVLTEWKRLCSDNAWRQIVWRNATPSRGRNGSGRGPDGRIQRNGRGPDAGTAVSPRARRSEEGWLGKGAALPPECAIGLRCWSWPAIRLNGATTEHLAFHLRPSSSSARPAAQGSDGPHTGSPLPRQGRGTRDRHPCVERHHAVDLGNRRCGGQ
eukprot:gene9957-biopygen18253